MGEPVFKNKDTNCKFNSFLHIFLNTFIVSFHIQNRSVRRIKKNWIAQGINMSRKHKRSLYMYSRSSNVLRIRAYIIEYCKILSRIIIKEAKRQHYCSFTAKLDNQTKITWTITKHENYMY